MSDVTVDTLAAEWPYEFQDVDTVEPIATYLGVYAEAIGTIQDSVDELLANRFIETATGRELEQLGAAIGVSREQGESDDDLRYRIQLQMAAAASDGTASDIEAVVDQAFPDAGLAEIFVTPVDGKPVLRFIIDEQYIDAVPIDVTRLTGIIESAFPCGTSIEILTEQPFTFAEDDQSAPGYAAGFGEGVWSGSTTE